MPTTNGIGAQQNVNKDGGNTGTNICCHVNGYSNAIIAEIECWKRRRRRGEKERRDKRGRRKRKKKKERKKEKKEEKKEEKEKQTK